MTEVLSYRFPSVNPQTTGNNNQWSNSLPINGSVFRSDQNQSIIFNIASTSQFLRTVQSFVSGRITPYDATGAVVGSAAAPAAATAITGQGLSRAFSRLVIRFGSAIVEDITSYSDLLALAYSIETPGRKRLLTMVEGTSNPAFLQRGPTYFAHMLYSSLFVTDQALPLPFISQGGISIELFLAPASDIFLSTNVAFYTIDQMSFKWLAITPDPTWTIQMKAAIASGKSAYVPMQRVHVFPSQGSGANDQIINIPIGQVSSIAGIQTAFWDSTGYANSANDKSMRFTNANLQSWNVLVAGLQEPNQISFEYGGGNNPETLLTAIISQIGNVYQAGEQVDIPNNFDTNAFRIALNFQSENQYFGNGMSTIGAASPFIVLSTKHSAPVPTTTSIISFVTVDCLIEFRGSAITVTEVF